MDKYLIYDVKLSTYLAPGTIVAKGGHVVPKWTENKADAFLFSTIEEAKDAIACLKDIKHQDNRHIICLKQ